MLKDIAKKYLPLAVLFVLVMAILGMSRYAETRKKNHQDNASHVNQVMITPDKAPDSTKETEKTEDSPSWVETFAWPNGVTAWSLLLTLFVVAWQSTETRDAAKAARDSIRLQEAALQQWMILRKWKVAVQIRRDVSAVFHVEFDLVNPTQFPLTIHNYRFKFGDEKDATTLDFLEKIVMAPDVPYTIDTKFWVPIHTEIAYSEGNPVEIGITGSVFYENCLGKSSEYPISGKLTFSRVAPGKVEAVFHQQHIPHPGEDQSQGQNPN